MLITRVINKEVSACNQCPYFADHPHEPSCDKLEEIGLRGWDTLVPRNKIDTRCPFLKPK